MSNAVEDNGNALGPVWIKSSLSFANSNCLEAARLSSGQIGVRDSKDPDGGILRFTPTEWSAFLRGVLNGEFDTLPGQCA